MNYRTVRINTGSKVSKDQFTAVFVDDPLDRKRVKTFPSISGVYHFRPDLITDQQAFTALRTCLIDHQLQQMLKELGFIEKLMEIDGSEYKVTQEPFDRLTMRLIERVAKKLKKLERKAAKLKVSNKHREISGS